VSVDELFDTLIKVLAGGLLAAVVSLYRARAQNKVDQATETLTAAKAWETLLLQMQNRVIEQQREIDELAEATSRRWSKSCMKKAWKFRPMFLGNILRGKSEQRELIWLTCGCSPIGSLNGAASLQEWVICPHCHSGQTVTKIEQVPKRKAICRTRFASSTRAGPPCAPAPAPTAAK
jgi:hypothetical protein